MIFMVFAFLEMLSSIASNGADEYYVTIERSGIEWSGSKYFNSVKIWTDIGTDGHPLYRIRRYRVPRVGFPLYKVEAYHGELSSTQVLRVVDEINKEGILDSSDEYSGSWCSSNAGPVIWKITWIDQTGLYKKRILWQCYEPTLENSIKYKEVKPFEKMENVLESLDITNKKSIDIQELSRILLTQYGVERRQEIRAGFLEAYSAIGNDPSFAVEDESEKVRGVALMHYHEWSKCNTGEMVKGLYDISEWNIRGILLDISDCAYICKNRLFENRVQELMKSGKIINMHIYKELCGK